jgi:two-component system nitrogen regulation response regulator NtrX
LENNQKSKILVADDDKEIRVRLEEVLQRNGYTVHHAQNTSEALRCLKENPLNLVLLDIRFPNDQEGIQVLKEIQKTNPNIPVIVLSAYGTIEISVKAIKLGAYDFIEKPFETERLLVTIKNALERERLQREVRELREDLLTKYEMVGTSEGIRKVCETIEQVAPSNASVLITGESGTGKELVAKAIHRLSPRSSGHIVVMNCAAMPESLLESELFGIEEKTATGVQERIGKFEQAHMGTLFLDEIGDMTPVTQAKVLRILEEKEFERVGGRDTIKVDVRMISATNHDLGKAIQEGQFREDLFYRINVVTIHIPPLRERKEDIPLLTNYYLERFCDENNVQKRFSTESIQLLLQEEWSGNVRQLMNFVERLVLLTQSDTIKVEDVNRAIGKCEETDFNLKHAREDFEKSHICTVLAQTGGRIEEAAKILGIERTNLYRKMKKLGIK